MVNTGGFLLDIGDLFAGKYQGAVRTLHSLVLAAFNERRLTPEIVPTSRRIIYEIGDRKLVLMQTTILMQEGIRLQWESEFPKQTMNCYWRRGELILAVSYPPLDLHRHEYVLGYRSSETDQQRRSIMSNMTQLERHIKMMVATEVAPRKRKVSRAWRWLPLLPRKPQE